MDMIEKEIEKAKEAQCFLAALTLALTIPSVCSTHKHWKWSTIKKEKERYPKWCEEYITGINGEKILTSEEYYALRCALLHNGDDSLQNQPVLSSLSGTKKYRINIPYTGRHSNFERINMGNRKEFCAAPVIFSITEAYKKFKIEYPDFVYPMEKDLEDIL